MNRTSIAVAVTLLAGFFASASDPNGVFAWNISDQLKNIKAPTQIIAGKEDGATPVAILLQSTAPYLVARQSARVFHPPLSWTS